MKFVILDNLRNLYNEMVKADEKRQQFMIEYNNVRADVFFFIDSKPFKLVFGIIGTGKFFEINVQRGFSVELPLENTVYRAIIDGFKINSSNSGPYNPKFFFEYINSKFPQTIKATKRAHPASIARYYSNVEEADKLYFIGFKDNTKAGNHVTIQNLEKTLKLMGEEAYKFCSEHNLSTCWSADPNCDNFDKWKTLMNQAGTQ